MSQLTLCALLLGGCFQVQDPLASTDAGVGKDNAAGNTGMVDTAGTSGSAVAGSGVAEYSRCGTAVVARDTIGCVNLDRLDSNGAGCTLYTSYSGANLCAPDTWKCLDDGKGGFVCTDPTTGMGYDGSTAGVSGIMGGAGGYPGGGVAGDPSGGKPVDPCNCDDGNACTLDSCDAAGKCVHESIATMTDADKDGLSNNCDCDDGNAEVHAGVTAFSQVGFTPSKQADSNVFNEKTVINGTAFDFDCSGYNEPHFTATASPCEAWAKDQPICLGEGWVLNAGEGIPSCGAGGAYQVCSFDAQKNQCLPTTIMLIQSCR